MIPSAAPFGDTPDQEHLVPTQAIVSPLATTITKRERMLNTLWDVCCKYQMNIDDVKEANPNLAQYGPHDKLPNGIKISGFASPCGSPTGSPKASTSMTDHGDFGALPMPPRRGSTSWYQKGSTVSIGSPSSPLSPNATTRRKSTTAKTLHEISEKYCVSMAELLEANVHLAELDPKATIPKGTAVHLPKRPEEDASPSSSPLVDKETIEDIEKILSNTRASTDYASPFGNSAEGSHEKINP